MKKGIAIILFASTFMIAVALSVLAQETLTPLSQPVLPKEGKQLDPACVKTAVEKRENAIQAAWDTFSTSIKSALQIRKTELLAAWDITDKAQRRATIQAAWEKFRESRIAARKALDQARTTAWQQFRKDRAACGSGPTNENPGVDIAL